jgi:hypothetical protein
LQCHPLPMAGTTKQPIVLVLLDAEGLCVQSRGGKM